MILHKYTSPSMSKYNFWNNILSLQPLGKISVSYEPGTNTLVLFRTDIWYQNCSMASRFSFLFNICSNTFILSQTVINTQGTALTFRRNLDDVQYV